jgi:hypothetical protein
MQTRIKRSLLSKRGMSTGKDNKSSGSEDVKGKKERLIKLRDTGDDNEMVAIREEEEEEKRKKNQKEK